MARLPAMMLGVVLLWPNGSVTAQSENLGATRKIASLGLLVANEAAGGLGIVGSLEFGSRKILPRTLLGFGGSVGYLRTTYRSYLSPDFDYSASRIPVHIFSRVNFLVDDCARLQAYVGPAVGIWFDRYSRELPDNASGDHDRRASLLLETGARYALTTRTAGWGQVNVGTGGPSVGFGLARRFR